MDQIKSQYSKVMNGTRSPNDSAASKVYKKTYALIQWMKGALQTKNFDPVKASESKVLMLTKEREFAAITTLSCVVLLISILFKQSIIAGFGFGLFLTYPYRFYVLNNTRQLEWFEYGVLCALVVLILRLMFDIDFSYVIIMFFLGALSDIAYRLIDFAIRGNHF